MDYQFNGFLEEPVFPETVSSFATISPEYKTSTVQLNNGAEQRNRVFKNHLVRMSISGAFRTVDYNELSIDPYAITDFTNFFHAVGGNYSGFRVKVPTDYYCSYTTGYLESGFGTGKPQYQLTKKYQSGVNFNLKPVKKPNPTTGIIVKRNGVEVQVGTTAGKIQIDYTTGLITFVADKQLNITNISVGGNCVVTTSQIHGLSDGTYIYLSGLGGNGLNNNSYQITVIDDYNFRLQGITNLSSVSTGFASVYPQPSDAIRWQGEFHHPMRFDDDFAPHFNNEGMIQIETINLKELRI